MKKTIFAILCCLTLGLGSAMAQDEMPQQNHGRRPGRGMRGGMEMLADTAITNQMNLNAKQLEEIDKLNAAYKEQVTAKMGKKDENGKKLSREEREARMESMKTLKSDARKQLRAILGDDAYIYYLEQAMDRQPMMGGPRGMMPGNGQQMRTQQRGGFSDFGGFGGGEDF